MNPAYAPYMPYPPQQYYGMPPYPNGMGSPGYYPSYSRSPPTMSQYVPMMGVSVPPANPQLAQHSPAAMATPYQPPPAPVPLPPQTPSSTHSAQLNTPLSTPQKLELPIELAASETVAQTEPQEAGRPPFAVGFPPMSFLTVCY